MARDKRKAKSLAAKYTEILIVVTVYWFVSISMVFLNKNLLSGMNLNAPLFVTMYQCLCSALICVVAAVLAKSNKRFRAICPVKLEFKPDVLIGVLPLSIIFVGMITFNNLCLKYVGVAFYFVGRSLTTVFNVALTYIVLGQKTSTPAVICCLVIIFGFFLGVDQEAHSSIDTHIQSNVSMPSIILVNVPKQENLSIAGVIYGILASLFVSLNAIQTKKVLPLVDNSVWILNFYNNINSIILLFILMMVTGEIPVIYSYENIFDSHFWFMMSLSGLFGFAIGFVTGLQIQVTTPLTHNISGTAKACAQTILAVVWFSEMKTILWWLSNFLVMIGSASYARVKQVEMQRHHETVNKLKGDDDDGQVLLEAVIESKD